MRPPPAWTSAQNASMSCLHGESARTPAGATAGAAAAAPAAAGAAAGGVASAGLASGLAILASGDGAVGCGVAGWAATRLPVIQTSRATAGAGYIISPLGPSIVIRAEQHAIPKVLRPAIRLRDGLAGARPRRDRADGEVLVDLPVRVPVQLDGDVARRHRGPDRGRLVEHELVEDQAGPDAVDGSHVQPHLVREQVRVRDEVLAGDLALPPGAPVVEAQEQRVEGLAPRSGGIVALGKRETVRQGRRPNDRGFVGRLHGPGGGGAGAALVLARQFPPADRAPPSRARRRVKTGG